MDRPLRIATRASKLALWQANRVRDLLREYFPGRPVELVELVSTGDATRDRPLFAIGGVGVFTKEIQQAVLDGRADLAVHSLKDLPTQNHAGLTLASVPERGPVQDVLLAPRFKAFENLPAGAVVATSSLRRRAQLLRKRPDLQLVDIRGNVETRIRKLHEEKLDGLLLAEAGVRRLGLESEITQTMPFDVSLPAVGQGALGIECRADDAPLVSELHRLEHRATRRATDAERAFLRELQGGCQVPIGAHATVAEGRLTLQGIVLSSDGTEWFADAISGAAKEADSLGAELGRRLIAQGVNRLLS